MDHTKNEWTVDKQYKKLFELVITKLDQLQNNQSTNRLSFNRYLEEELTSLLKESKEPPEEFKY